jgi:hypothetical protein
VPDRQVRKEPSRPHRRVRRTFQDSICFRFTHTHYRPVKKQEPFVPSLEMLKSRRSESISGTVSVFNDQSRDSTALSGKELVSEISSHHRITVVSVNVRAWNKGPVKATKCQ